MVCIRTEVISQTQWPYRCRSGIYTKVDRDRGWPGDGPLPDIPRGLQQACRLTPQAKGVPPARPWLRSSSAAKPPRHLGETTPGSFDFR
eukprot:scaffold81183_cov19-Prasinocladus_malaysianus.AAC.1